jgi:hypothetical protein
MFERRWTALDRAAEQLTFDPAKTFARRAAEWMRHREKAEN